MSKIFNNSYFKLLFPFVVAALFFLFDLPMNQKLFFAITVWGVLSVALDSMPAIAVTILMPMLYVILQVAPANVAYSSWGNMTISMVLACLVVVTALNESGLLMRISAKILKLCSGNYVRVCWGMFFAALILGIATFASSSIIIAALTAGMVSTLGLSKTKEGMLIFMGALWAGVSAQVFFYYPLSASIISSATNAAIGTNYNLTWLQQFSGLWPLLFVSILVQFITMKVYGASKSNVNLDVAYFEKMVDQMGPISKKERNTAILFVLLMVYVLLTPITGLDATYGFILFVTLCFVPVMGVADINTIKHVDWTMMFFVATFLAIGSVAAYCGVDKIFSSVLVDIATTKGVTVALIALFVFGTLANLILTPIAILTTFGGVAAQLAVTMGFDPMVSILVLIMTEWMIILPYESMPTAVTFGFDAVTIKQFFSYSMIRIIVMFIALLVILIPMWKLYGWL